MFMFITKIYVWSDVNQYSNLDVIFCLTVVSVKAVYNNSYQIKLLEVLKHISCFVYFLNELDHIHWYFHIIIC